MNAENKTPLVDLLRGIKRNSTAEITEPNGWSYHTNIGELTHTAAEELTRLQRVEQAAKWAVDHYFAEPVGIADKELMTLLRAVLKDAALNDPNTPA